MLLSMTKTNQKLKPTQSRRNQQISLLKKDQKLLKMKTRDPQSNNNKMITLENSTKLKDKRDKLPQEVVVEVEVEEVEIEAPEVTEVEEGQEEEEVKDKEILIDLLRKELKKVDRELKDTEAEVSTEEEVKEEVEVNIEEGESTEEEVEKIEEEGSIEEEVELTDQRLKEEIQNKFK